VEAAVQSFFTRAEAPAVPGADRSWPRLAPPSADRVAEAAQTVAGGPRVLGQHRLTYIVATDGDDLLLVDQHTAHERVRFERLMRQVEQRAVESQRLLLPLVLELAPDCVRPRRDAEALTVPATRSRPLAAPRPGSSACPRSWDARPGPALERLLRDLLEREAGVDRRERARPSGRDLACHSAVRAGQGLTPKAWRPSSAISRARWSRSSAARPPDNRAHPRDEVSRWFGRSGWKRK